MISRTQKSGKCYETFSREDTLQVDSMAVSFDLESIDL